MSDIRTVVHAASISEWLAGYSNGVVATSTDGQVFTPGVIVFSLAHGVNSIGWNGVDLFVAVSDHGELSTSPDGVSWTPRTSSFGTTAIRAVFFAGGVWVAVGVGGKIATSTAGTLWTQRTNPFTDDINCVTFGGGRWIAGGNSGQGAISADGITWTAITTTGFGSSTIQAVAWGIGLYIFVGQSGKLFTSPDAATFTSRTSTFGSSSIKAIGFYPTLFTIGGVGGAVASSTDGVTWTSKTSGLSVDILAVANVLFAGTIQATGQAIPTIQSYSSAPTKIDPARSMGMRAQVSLVIADHPWADRDTDKYFRERSYDASTQGTYWGKWLARNPYYQNRILNIYTGYLEEGNIFVADNFSKRTYLIDRIAGPSKNQTVTITAKDVLKLADDKRAQAPAPSTGTLATDILDTDTSFSLLPAGVGDLEYPVSGTLAIGAECITFTRSADLITVLNRGTGHTTAESHSMGDAVQLCLRYHNMNIQSVVYDLLVTYGNVDPSYINMTQWNAEANVWLLSAHPETLIAKPEGVTTLLNELTQQFMFYIWWDERNQTIPLKAIHPSIFGETVELGDQNNFLYDSVSLADDPTQRISEVFIYYGQINPLLDLTRIDNFNLQQVNVDLTAESAAEYGETRYQVIYSRWMKNGGQQSANTLGSRLLKKYRNNPRILTFSLDARDAGVWTADYILATTRVYQDQFGASPASGFQILSAQEKIPGTTFEYVCQDDFFSGRYGYITPNDWPVYSMASDIQKRTGGFISQNDGTMLNGDPGYQII